MEKIFFVQDKVPRKFRMNSIKNVIFPYFSFLYFLHFRAYWLFECFLYLVDPNRHFVKVKYYLYTSYYISNNF